MSDKKDELSNTQVPPLAYENAKFLNSPDGRVLRIEAEYLEPLARFRRERIQDTVVFFGSARFHSRSQAEEALQLLDKPGSAKLAPPEEQARIRRAKADVEMARYYDDARSWPFRLQSGRRPSTSRGIALWSLPAAVLGSWKQPTLEHRKPAGKRLDSTFICLL